MMLRSINNRFSGFVTEDAKKRSRKEFLSFT